LLDPTQWRTVLEDIAGFVGGSAAMPFSSDLASRSAQADRRVVVIGQASSASRSLPRARELEIHVVAPEKTADRVISGSAVGMANV
jgi:hypothetical protein